MSLIGQSLGRYHILDQLGEGGMATVYKAYDTRLETDVAVKVIRTESLPQNAVERALKRFEREAKALARLTHANIVKVTDYGEYENKPYLVMPFLPGGTLKQMLNGKPVPWRDAIHILLPIAHALAYAHEQGMVHRDVKPSNILITRSGDPMLTDFGIARILDEEFTLDLTGTGAVIGTPEYMAPEQATSKVVDARADIYALSIVLYEMVTGRKPYVADTPLAVMIMHSRDPLPRPRDFTPALPQTVENLLLKGLARAPENRYQSMAEFAIALEALQGAPGDAAEGRGQSGRPFLSRRQTSVIGGLVVLVVALFAIVRVSGGLAKPPIPLTATSPARSTQRSTAVPTASLEPSLTSAASPSPMTEASTTGPENVPLGADVPRVDRVAREEKFDSFVPFAFHLDIGAHGNYSLSNGILSVEEPLVSGDPWADGASGIWSDWHVQHGNGYLLLFRTKPGAYFIVDFETGTAFAGPDYRAFWFEAGQSYSFWSGANQVIVRSLDLPYKADTWYYLLTWLTADGVEGKIWEKDHPEIGKLFSVTTGANWASPQFIYKVNVAQGTMEFDDFQEVEFVK